MSPNNQSYGFTIENPSYYIISVNSPSDHLVTDEAVKRLFKVECKQISAYKIYLLVSKDEIVCLDGYIDINKICVKCPDPSNFLVFEND